MQNQLISLDEAQAGMVVVHDFVEALEPVFKTAATRIMNSISSDTGPAKVFKRLLDDLSGTSDPTGVLSIVLAAAKIVSNQLEAMQEASDYALKLGEKIMMLMCMLQGLNELPRTDRFLKGLRKFQHCIEEAGVFVIEYNSKGKIKKFFCSVSYKKQFEDLILELNDAQCMFELGIQIQATFDREEDKEELQKNQRHLLQDLGEIGSMQAQHISQLQELKENTKKQGAIAEAQYATILKLRADTEEQKRLTAAQRKAMEKLLTDAEEQKRIAAARQESIEHGFKDLIALLPKEEVNDEISRKLFIPFYDLEIYGLLKKGSFATIYLGKWCGEQVAIKKLEGIINVADRQQFIREVKIMSQLRNAFIVQFHGVCFEEHRMALVMEYMDEGTLREFLDRKKLTPKEQKQIALDIAKGLLFLHKQNIIHCDLKSANVLIDQYGRAKITDFGLSKTKSKSIENIAEISKSCEWMAPEVLNGSLFTAKSDVYSYGVLLWEIITGKQPYIGLTEKTMRDECTASGEKLGDIKELALYIDIIQRCWSRNVQDRPELTEIINIFEQHDAQLTPAELYAQGRESEKQKDYVHAKELYAKAGDAGFCKAYTKLGLFCLIGKGCSIDKEQAFKFMLKGAEAGFVRAQFNLAQMLERGDGVEKNILQACEWYKKAADQGHEESQIRLFSMQTKHGKVTSAVCTVL